MKQNFTGNESYLKTPLWKMGKNVKLENKR